jgi:hypothetical protein
MREIGLTGGLYDVAFLGTVDLLCRIVGNPIDIAVAILACHTAMRTAVEQLLVDIEEPELTAFVNAAQASVFMAEYTVEFIVRLSRDAKNQQNKRAQQVDE